MTFHRARPAAWLILAALVVSSTAAAQPGADAALGLRLDSLRDNGAIGVAGLRVDGDPRLLAFYESRGRTPVWDEAKGARLLAAVRAADGHGLTPGHYHLAELESLAAAVDPERTETVADLDLLRTVSLLELAEDLRFGKVAPAERDPPSEPSTRALTDGDLDALFAAADLAAAVDGLAPRHYAYRGLRRALVRYREIAAAGGFPVVGEGAPMRRSGADPRVPALRRRLAASGDLAAADTVDGEVFDTALERAVQRFQQRHGLNDDGIVGTTTLAELAVPVEARIDQVRVNMERARWILRDPPVRSVVVNVAGQRLYLVRGGEVTWETRVVVGRLATRTPTFRAMLSDVVLNPTWTVPASIAPEVVADARRDPAYLSRLGFQVLDAAGGAVDPAAVEAALAEGGRFPYRFRQSAGRANALGDVKLNFENPYGVYLHDTPARSFFAKEHRTFSHGCVRVEDPLRLAELVLEDPAWDRKALEAAVATGKTRSVKPAVPWPVLILYWTAAADLHGELHLYKDVYSRDAGLLEDLGRG